MPVKIGFQVVSCSGEDEKYRVNELNYHGPTVRGWRSSANCAFPQEIVLQLKVPAILHQIQILVHQYLIPQKIEIHTSSKLDFETPSDGSPDLFQYLGFITFSNNQATGFRSRELKSILIPSRKAKYLKLKIYNNHENVKNIFNQVGLIGINILGDEVDLRTEENELNNNVCIHPNTFAPTIPFNSHYISPYDDLAFEMYVDEETARIIKLIEYKKQQAILEEHFEYANILKITLQSLRSAGEIIGLYEQEKKQAIQVEDYDRAKLKKLQIANFRQKVYSALNIDQVLDASDNEEKSSVFNLSHTEDLNNSKMINSPPESVVNDNLEFQDKFLHGLSSPLKLRGHQSSSSCHLIHSKSQTSFINHRDTASPTFLKNQAFSTSISNPQLNLYLKESQGRNFQGNYKGEPKTALAPEFEFIRTPSSSPSSSSDADDTALFTSSDVLKYPTNNLGIVVQPPKQSNEREKGEDRYESLKDAKNYTHWSRIPSSRSPSENFNERSRPKVCEHSKVRSKSVTTNATKSSFEAYEDRMLPALKSYHGNEVVRECQFTFDQQTKTTLNEREKKQAMLPISVFGTEMVEKFYSKSFSDKEEGLKKLQTELKRIINSTQESDGSINNSYNKIARAAIFLLHRALRDKVYSVYSGAAETVRLFFTEFVPQRVSSSEVARSVEKLLPELLTKSGDSTPRIHNMAAHTLLTMADCEEVKRLHIISSHLSRPLMSSVHPRLALSRLEMVEQLILNHGISQDKRSGLTCRILAEFGSSGLHHPAEAVRKVSERILLHVYKVNPKIVRKQLPPDDNVTRRNLLYRQLFQEFDYMDMQKKPSEQDTKDPIIKFKISTQNCAKQTSEFSPKRYSTFNFQECSGKKSPNPDSLQKHSKTVVSLNLRDNDKIKGSPHKELSTSPSRPIEKALNKISTESSISSSANDSYVEGGSSLKAKDLNVIINERQQAKIENNSKLLLNAVGDKNKIECDAPGVKFPSLADSIDTTKARMLFEQGKNLKPKKVDCTLRKNKIRDTITQNNAKLNYNSVQKREIKRDINVSSGIPLPTFGSTRKYYTNISRKTEKEKKLESTPSLSRRKAENSIQNSKLISKSTNNKFDSAHEKEIIEMAVLKKEMIGRLQKNAGISVEDFKYCLEKNIEKVNKNYEKASEKSNKFSESMLASIRENEYPPISMHNGLNNESKGLKTCIFCLSSKKWATDDSLNNHYLKECPMLTTCEYCAEVIEISGFTNHLLDECNQKQLFQKCSMCHQAVLEGLLENHECSASTNKAYKTICPFCHKDIGGGESCWRKHLMGSNICSNHPRNAV